jgi:hypothetical protein
VLRQTFITQLLQLKVTTLIVRCETSGWRSRSTFLLYLNERYFPFTRLFFFPPFS